MGTQSSGDIMQCSTTKSLETLRARRRTACAWALACLFVCMSLAPARAVFAQERSKSLDFEDSTIEGVNKQPLDSLSQISDRDAKRKKNHLYWKKTHFHPETQESLRELRYIE